MQSTSTPRPRAKGRSNPINRHDRAVVERIEPRTLLSALPPGATIPTPGTSLAARPELAGTVVYDTLVPVASVDKFGSVVFYGYLEDRVVRETAGTLDFYQSLRADLIPHSTPVQTTLDTASRTSFAGFATDADWRTDGLGTSPISPSTATRSSDGKTVTFNFDKPISTGQTSYFYFVKTNATNFDVNGTTTLTFGPSSGPGAATATLQTAEPIGSHGNPTGSVNGTVTLNPGPNATPLADTVITLVLTQGKKSMTITTITDSNGGFVLGGLKPGKYSVQLQPPPGTTTAPGTSPSLDIKPNGNGADSLDFDLVPSV